MLRVAGPHCQLPAFSSCFLAVLRQQVENDWQRTMHDIRWNAGVPASWFRGRSPELEVADFKQLWCVGGVIAAVTAIPRRELRRWSLG